MAITPFRTRDLNIYRNYLCIGPPGINQGRTTFEDHIRYCFRTLEICNECNSESTRVKRILNNVVPDNLIIELQFHEYINGIVYHKSYSYKI
jgi:hypothetical protein